MTARNPDAIENRKTYRRAFTRARYALAREFPFDFELYRTQYEVEEYARGTTAPHDRIKARDRARKRALQTLGAVHRDAWKRLLAEQTRRAA